MTENLIFENILSSYSGSTFTVTVENFEIFNTSCINCASKKNGGVVYVKDNLQFLC